ncbi:hypothetical protein MMC13_008324 [Lambiella insularis]|nr:hypothetical protein [Lambiella insularis]
MTSRAMTSSPEVPRSSFPETSALPPIVSGFTPINGLIAQRKVGSRKDESVPVFERIAKVPKGGRKREANQLATPPATAKRAKKELVGLSTKAVDGRTSKAAVNLAVALKDDVDDVQRWSNPVAQHIAGKAKGKSQKAMENEYGLSAKTLSTLASFRYQGEPTSKPDVLLPSTPSDQNIIPEGLHQEQGTTFVAHIIPTDTCTFMRDKDDRCTNSEYSEDESAFDDRINDLLHRQTLDRSSVPFEESDLPAPEAEFFMDEQAIQDLSELPVVQESFEPPSSLQVPFDDNSQTNEVYDPKLRHSRPSSTRSLHSIQVDGVTIPVGSRTTIDAYRSAQFPLSPSAMDSPCTAPVMEHDETLTGFDEEADLLDEDLDSDMLDLAIHACYETRHSSPTLAPQESELPKLQWNRPTVYKPTQSSRASDPVHSSSPRPSPSRLPLADIPTSSTNIPPPAPHLLSFDKEGNALPFARPPFPRPVRDRSPIIGLSSSPLLRTCFRIGEALNAASLARHINAAPLIELYARVTYSRRVGVEQFVQFADLFRSEKPPFLSGSYVGWKGVDLWDCDSKVFLGDGGKGKIARCVGRMKRDEARKTWKMMVLSMWEATWEDVAYAKGIVCS